jgi:hypothetical protein
VWRANRIAAKVIGCETRPDAPHEAPQPSGALCFNAKNFWRRGRESNPRMMVLQTIPLGHLGTAPHDANSMPTFYTHFYAQRTLLSPIYTVECLSKPLKPCNPDSKQGFADLSLGPLGYRAKLLSIAKVVALAFRLRRPSRGGERFSPAFGK